MANKDNFQEAILVLLGMKQKRTDYLQNKKDVGDLEKGRLEKEIKALDYVIHIPTELIYENIWRMVEAEIIRKEAANISIDGFHISIRFEGNGSGLPYKFDEITACKTPIDEYVEKVIKAKEIVKNDR